MATRPVGIVMEPEEAHEAPGVLIQRTIGSDKLVLLDPVLLLDHLGVDTNAGATPVIGFPRHPHRGIETLTYVFAGRMQHKDSLGNEDTVGRNESQWMTAGGGIFHEEMVETVDGGHNSLQIWFNLPAAEKRKAPHYQAARSFEIPELELPGGGVVRVVAGAFQGTNGAFQEIAVRPTYLDVTLSAGSDVILPAPSGQMAFAYLHEGAASFGEPEKSAEAPRLIIFGDGDDARVRATDREARFIFVSARPLGEPVLQYRSLVMNTVDQMKEALEDLERGTFAQNPA